MEKTNGALQKNNTVFADECNFWTLDLLKVLLAVVVILRHCGQQFYSPESLFVKIITCSISPIAVPTFFTISGFLLFRKEVSVNVLKRQAFRVIRLYLLWSLIYSPIIVRYAQKKESVSKLLISFLRKFFFGGAYYHLWFLPSLAVALCITYTLWKLVRNNNYLLLIALVLYVIGTIVDTYHFFSPYTDWKLYKDIFLTTRNGVFFGFFFVVIGKVIAEGQIVLEKKSVIFCSLILGCILLILEGWFLCWANRYSVVNMNFSSIFISPSLLIIAIQTSKRFSYSNGKELRNMSTVLFCCHPWMMVVILLANRMMCQFNSMWSTIMTLILSATAAYVCVRLSKNYKVFRELM